jgi:polyisoprenoid-binding protein YceI
MAVQLTPGTWNLDKSHTEVGFSVRHAVASSPMPTPPWWSATAWPLPLSKLS